MEFMNGQHRVAHFFNGRETPASDVIQVNCVLIVNHFLSFCIAILLNYIIDFVATHCDNWICCDCHTGPLSLGKTGQRIPQSLCPLDNVKQLRYICLPSLISFVVI